MGGGLELIGETRTTWTTLASTASKGATKVTIVGQHDMKKGDEITITTTSYRTSETETRTITAVSGDTLTLDSALNYNHFGKIFKN